MKDRTFATALLMLSLLISAVACSSTDSNDAVQPAEPAVQLDASSVPAAAASATDTVDETTAKYDPSGKFAFAVSELRTGTRMDAQGRPVPFRYEFCVPKRSDAIAALATLDPTVIVETREKGQIGCDDQHLMAHGHTGQPNYLKVLAELAKQDFIDKIILVR